MTICLGGVLCEYQRGRGGEVARLLLAVLIIGSLAFGACAAPSAPAPAPTPTPEPTPAPTPAPAPKPQPAPISKITIEDGPRILDLFPLCPGFEKLDAASEGMSLENMGIYDPNCCEVQLFLLEEPFQMTYGFLCIDESRVAQVGFDAVIRDTKQVKTLVEENLKAGAAEEGIELTVPEIQITYPNIGDAAVLAEGQMETYGFIFGFDTLWFRQKSVHVFLYSTYGSLERQTLVPFAEAIKQRIDQYSH